MSIIAISDIGTLLYVKGENDKYSKFISIASATSEAPDTIEVITLKSKVKQDIPDRPGTLSYELEANYTKENYEALILKISFTEELRII